MDRGGLIQDLSQGFQVDSTRRSTYKYASLGSGLTGTGTTPNAKLLDTPGVIRTARVIFGAPTTANAATLTYPTISLTDDGSTGRGSIKFLTFPQGVVRIYRVFPSLTLTVSGSFTVTSPVASIGSAAAGNNATLTSTEADFVASTAITLTSRSGPFTAEDLQAIVSLTDSSGGSAGATLTAVPSTYDQAITRNAIASLAAKINSVLTNFANTRIITWDGSSSALDLYLNFAHNSDPGSSATVTVSGYIDVAYQYMSARATQSF